MTTYGFTPIGTTENRHSEKDRNAYELSEKIFDSSIIRTFDKLEAFPRFSTKRSLAKFLCKYEVFKKILHINGVIIECGVFNGSGLFTWAQLSNIFEPTNYNRKIIGFDTFNGFPSTSTNDENDIINPTVGDLRGDSFESLLMSIEKYNNERQLSHIPNIELVRGDFMETSEVYLQKNSHLLVSLLYLDFDLYEPTKKALEVFRPRMGKGSVICFDELNCANYPGETLALLEEFDLRNISIERFPTDPWLSYIVL